MFETKFRIAANCGLAMAFISIASAPSAKGDTYGFYWNAREASTYASISEISGLGFADVNYSGANYQNFLGEPYNGSTAHGVLDMEALANSNGGLDPGYTPPAVTSGPLYSSARANCGHEVSVSGIYGNFTHPNTPLPSNITIPGNMATLNQAWFASSSAAASFKWTGTGNPPQFVSYQYALGKASSQTTTSTPIPSDTAAGFGATLLATSPIPQPYGLAPVYSYIGTTSNGYTHSESDNIARARGGYEIIQNGALVYGFQDDWVVGIVVATNTYPSQYYAASPGTGVLTGGIGGQQTFDTAASSFNGSGALGVGWSSITAVAF